MKVVAHATVGTACLQVGTDPRGRDEAYVAFRRLLDHPVDSVRQTAILFGVDAHYARLRYEANRAQEHEPHRLQRRQQQADLEQQQAALGQQQQLLQRLLQQQQIDQGDEPALHVTNRRRRRHAGKLAGQAGVELVVPAEAGTHGQVMLASGAVREGVTHC